MSQDINDAGWFIVSELPNCLNLNKACHPDQGVSSRIRSVIPIIVWCVILSKAKDLSLDTGA